MGFEDNRMTKIVCKIPKGIYVIIIKIFNKIDVQVFGNQRRRNLGLGKPRLCNATLAR